MPQKRSAYKELRKGKKSYGRNVALVSELRTLVKQFNSLVAEKKTDEAKEFLKTVSSKLNKAAAKGVVHKNTASRNLSRLSRKLYRALPH
jgi:small subunit ribosomal protein S20